MLIFPEVSSLPLFSSQIYISSPITPKNPRHYFQVSTIHLYLTTLLSLKLSSPKQALSAFPFSYILLPAPYFLSSSSTNHPKREALRLPFQAHHRNSLIPIYILCSAILKLLFPEHAIELSCSYVWQA